ncbi:hypothetical protein KKC13_05720 [bacterium]|nr:hypothetical protein [bacterium]MBU1957347.1 hypothetical protein [bacterium]
MKKLNIIFISLLLLFIGGCDEKVVDEPKKEITKVEVVEKNVTKEEENDLLKQLGFDFSDDKIVIDINKTSNFFEKIELQMEEKAKEIEQKIENADLNMTKDMGIELEGEQIGIDLNKTRNMLQQINILMKDIFLDINTSNH